MAFLRRFAPENELALLPSLLLIWLPLCNLQANCPRELPEVALACFLTNYFTAPTVYITKVNIMTSGANRASVTASVPRLEMNMAELK